MIDTKKSTKTKTVKKSTVKQSTGYTVIVSLYKRKRLVNKYKTSKTKDIKNIINNAKKWK